MEVTKELIEAKREVKDIQFSKQMNDTRALTYNGLGVAYANINDLNSSINNVSSSLDKNVTDINENLKETNTLIKVSLDSFRREFDNSISRIRIETDLSMEAIKSITEASINSINYKLSSVESRISTLEEDKNSSIGMMAYTLLNECPAGWIELNGSEIESSVLRDKLEAYETPDLRGYFIRYNDNELLVKKSDTTAVNGLIVNSAVTHVTYSPEEANTKFMQGLYTTENTLRMSYVREHTHALNGDSETAPKHVNLILCIKG